MFVFKEELFEQKADMLLYALEEGIIKDIDIFSEMQGLVPEEAVQLVLDYGNMDEICAALLEFDEEPVWMQNC